jgi:hypothetical protein
MRPLGNLCRCPIGPFVRSGWRDRGVRFGFFIGISLLVNGALILGAGIYQLVNPPANPGVALFYLRANVWWAAVLLICGVFYCVRFAPKRT